jgi:hypothetical protein
MNKISKNENGFSVVEILMVLVVVVLIVVVGWLIYKNHHKVAAPVVTTSTNKSAASTSTKTTTTTVSPYAGWQTYSNSQVSFEYPRGWAASNGPGDSQSTVADTTSATYASSATTTLDNLDAPIDLYLQLSTDTLTIDCADAPCQVTTIAPLSNLQLPGAVLAVVNQTSNNGTKFTQYVVASGSTKVGDTTVSAVKTGSSGIYIFGQPEYNTNGQGVTSREAASVNDANIFQSDSHFQDLIKLIDSIKFN